MQNATIHKVSGPHPAGNVSVQIAKIDPINKGEVVWVVNAQDLLIIGELLLKGKFKAERTIALAGASVKTPKYYKTIIGAQVSSVVYDSGVHDEANIRVISGDVLTGENVRPDGHLGYYHSSITVIPGTNRYSIKYRLPEHLLFHGYFQKRSIT